jgi:hypothetical protein
MESSTTRASRGIGGRLILSIIRVNQFSQSLYRRSLENTQGENTQAKNTQEFWAEKQAEDRLLPITTH